MNDVPPRSEGKDPSFVRRFGPWALVAGASEGIGAAFAQGLARRGLDLVLVARRVQPLAVTASRMRAEHGVQVREVVCDLGRPDRLADLFRATADCEVGLLVYNAALAPIGPFFRLSVEEHLAILELNCRTPLQLAHHFGQAMAARGRGGILLMSSLSGLQGTPLVAHYAATRAYNLVLAEGLWEELESQGVAVLASCAGRTRTPGYEASRPARPPLFLPPVLEPELVAEESLQALGRRPSLIPGQLNRLTSSVISRLLPRRWSVKLTGRAMRRMYGEIQ